MHPWVSDTLEVFGYAARVLKPGCRDKPQVSPYSKKTQIYAFTKHLYSIFNIKVIEYVKSDYISIVDKSKQDLF